MRFLYKRPRIEDVSEELITIMDVMASKIFIMMDLFWISLIFTLFLSPVLATVKMSILFFSGCFVLFNLLYFCFFYDPSIKKH
jgi:antibiotic biosynthesis monooxygenase (ABM) superfamily enzyme